MFITHIYIWNLKLCSILNFSICPIDFKGNYVLHDRVNLQKHLKLKWKPFKIDKLEQQRFVHWHHSFSLFCTFITCSSHVFTNPESFYMLQNFLCFFFFLSVKFWIKIKINQKNERKKWKRKDSLKPLQKQDSSKHMIIILLKSRVGDIPSFDHDVDINIFQTSKKVHLEMLIKLYAVWCSISFIWPCTGLDYWSVLFIIIFFFLFYSLF